MSESRVESAEEREAGPVDEASGVAAAAWDDDRPVPGSTLAPPGKYDFGGRDFLEAPAVADLGDELIRRHEELRDLAEFEIAYLWKKKGGSPKGRPRWGYAQRLSGVAAHYASCELLVVIAADHLWALAEFGQPVNLEALVYHELKHFRVEEDEDGGREVVLRGHEVEMFYDEVRRYGLWKSDLVAASRTFKQLALPEGE